MFQRRWMFLGKRYRTPQWTWACRIGLGWA